MTVASQPFDIVELCEIPVEGAEGHVTSFPRDLQDQAVRKPQRRPRAKAFDSGGYHLRILKCQMLVVEEHFDGGRNFARATLVDRSQDPRGFGKDEMGNPSSARDKILGRCDLLDVVARDEPDQHVGVNGSHDVF